jgi:hypothetical protein
MILGEQTILKLIFLILLILALSSCASVKEKEEIGLKEEESEIMVDEAPSLEAEIRKPIYVYESQPKKISSSKVTLKLNSEPLLLSNGYVRLAGVVSGGRPMALIEIGGRGRSVEIGEEVGEYKIVNILGKAVRLLRQGGN